MISSEQIRHISMTIVPMHGIFTIPMFDIGVGNHAISFPKFTHLVNVRTQQKHMRKLTCCHSGWCLL